MQEIIHAILVNDLLSGEKTNNHPIRGNHSIGRPSDGEEAARGNIRIYPPFVGLAVK